MNKLYQLVMHLLILDKLQQIQTILHSIFKLAIGYYAAIFK